MGSYEDPCYVMHGPPPSNPSVPWTAGPVYASILTNMALSGGTGADGSVAATGMGGQSGPKNYPNSASGRGGGHLISTLHSFYC